MDIEKVRKWVTYQKTERHSDRINNQQKYQRLYEDNVPTPLVKKKEYRSKLGIIPNMANGIMQQAISVIPKVYTEGKKDDDIDIRACDRVASTSNKWVKSLSHQSTNPFRETFKELAFTRGEAYIYTPHNEFLGNWDDKLGNWRDFHPNIIPIDFIIYDPLVIFADPSEEVNGDFKRVAISYKRKIGDLKANYPHFNSRKWDKTEVEFLYYCDEDEMYAEADQTPLMTDSDGNLLYEGHKNPYGFVPISHGYSGYGSGTENKDPALLTMTKTGMLEGKLTELYTMASDFQYNITDLAWKHRTLVLPLTAEDVATEALKNYHPDDPGALSILYTPDGIAPKVEETQSFDAPVFSYFNMLRRDVAAEFPGPLKGDPSGLTSGREADILGGSALAMYDAPIEANNKLWADALKKAFRVFKEMPDLIPPGLQNGDFDRVAEIIVDTRKEDAAEINRKRAAVLKEWQLGFRSHKDALMQLGYTKEEAQKMSVEAWVEQMKRENPTLVQMIMNVMAQELDQEEQLAQIQMAVKETMRGVNPRPEIGSKGGGPREQNIKTELGREMGVEESRPARMSPV